MIVSPSLGKNFLPRKLSFQRSNNKMVIMAAFVYHLNWNLKKKRNCPNGGYNIENFFIFCLLLLSIFARQAIKAQSNPGLSLFYTDTRDIPQKTLQYCNIDPLLTEPGTYCMEGA